MELPRSCDGCSSNFRQSLLCQKGLTDFHAIPHTHSSTESLAQNVTSYKYKVTYKNLFDSLLHNHNNIKVKQGLYINNNLQHNIARVRYRF